MTMLDLRFKIFKALGWTDLAVRPPAPHHWPFYPIDELGHALTGRAPGIVGFREPGPLDLPLMDKLFKHYETQRGSISDTKTAH